MPAPGVTLPFPRQAPDQVAPSSVINDMMTELEWLDGFVSVELGAVVTRSSAQSIPTAVQTFTNFTTVEYDPWGMVNLSADSRVVTIGGDGIYAVFAYGQFAQNATGARIIAVDNNLTQYGSVGCTMEVPVQPSGAFTTLAASGTGLLAGGTRVSLVAYQDSGGALNFSSARLAIFRIALNH
ncbi:MAG TPA: hypothetical protein VF054_06615 [Micromonosporaceae bacterium]